MIRFNKVNFTYAEKDSTPNLDTINFSIKRGEVVLLCGESGCGKTTIARLINGLIPHYYNGELTGEIEISNQSTKAQELQQISKNVGTVFQNPRSQFFSTSTTGELAFGCENQGVKPAEIKRRCDKVIASLRLDSLMDRNIFQLSGGEKQRLACGAVSVTENSVYVLDEPSSNLDALSIEDLKQQICYWKGKNRTIIIAEHRLYYLKELVDRVFLMKDGQIVKEYSASAFNQLSAADFNSLGLRTLSLDSVGLTAPKQFQAEQVLINQLNFSYKKSQKKALAIEGLKIPKGSVTAIIGHNGAGKTTFARCFCGLEKKSKSEIYVNDTQLKHNDRLRQSYLVMQDVNHQLFTESVLEEVLLSMSNPDESQAMLFLEKLGIARLADLHPLSLSGGQKQRVAIASALASECEYIFFDEPTSGLDFYHMQEVATCINQLTEMGKTVFLITHDLELISRCSSHLLHLKNSRVYEHYELTHESFEQAKAFFIV